MFERLDDPFAGIAPAAYHSLCVADIDGCGPHALLLAARDGANHILALTPAGPVPCDPDALADAAHATEAVCAADVDGDGAEEILLCRQPRDGRWGEAVARLLDLDAGVWSDLLAEAMQTAEAGAGPVAAVAVPAVGIASGILVLRAGALLQLHATAAGAGLRDLAAETGLDEITPAGAVRYLPWPGPADALLIAAGNGLWVSRRGADGRFLDQQLLALGDGPEIGTLLPVAAPPDGRLDLLAVSACGPQRLLAVSPEQRVCDVVPRLLA